MTDVSLIKFSRVLNCNAKGSLLYDVIHKAFFGKTMKGFFDKPIVSLEIFVSNVPIKKLPIKVKSKAIVGVQLKKKKKNRNPSHRILGWYLESPQDKFQEKLLDFHTLSELA